MKGMFRKLRMLSGARLTAIAAVVTMAICLLPMKIQAENGKPVALISGSQEVSQGQRVYLDGSISSDPQGRQLDYSWTLVSAPDDSVAVLSPEGAQVSFEADAVGTYKVKLVVSAGLTESDPAYALIRVIGGMR